MAINPTAQTSECPICLEDTHPLVTLHAAPPRVAGGFIVPHAFHTECIANHFRHELTHPNPGPLDGRIQFRCPTCRVRLIPNLEALIAFQAENKMSCLSRVSRAALGLLHAAEAHHGTLATLFTLKQYGEGSKPLIYFIRDLSPASIGLQRYTYSQFLNVAGPILDLFTLGLMFTVYDTERIHNEIFLKFLACTLITIGGSLTSSLFSQLLKQFLPASPEAGMHDLCDQAGFYLTCIFLQGLKNQIERLHDRLYLLHEDTHTPALNAAEKERNFERFFHAQPEQTD